MEKARIIFKNGTELETDRNGDCFIVDEEPTFPSDLSGITITGEGEERFIENGQIIECTSLDGRYWFAIREIPDSEMEKERLEAKLAYLAMMVDVDLEEVG